MKARETVRCTGHPHVRGTHHTTFEVTAEDHLTTAGTCIIAIGADKGAATLSEDFRALLARNDAVLSTTLKTEGSRCTVHSHGSSRMTLDHPTDMVWRRSSFVCGRTVGILSDHVAGSLPRELIGALQRGGDLVVEMEVVIPDRAR